HFCILCCYHTVRKAISTNTAGFLLLMIHGIISSDSSNILKGDIKLGGTSGDFRRLFQRFTGYHTSRSDATEFFSDRGKIQLKQEITELYAKIKHDNFIRSHGIDICSSVNEHYNRCIPSEGNDDMQKSK
ncbi:hypothetical protein L9F63_024635, partial [Diploptera punctata]